MIRYKENQDWECSIEKMISYLIEANRTITDPKEKKLSNYIVAVRHQLETKDYDTISNRIDTTTYDKYFETTEKWKKINGKFITNYASLIFSKLLLEFGDITQDKIVRETKIILDKYDTITVLLSDSLKCLNESII